MIKNLKVYGKFEDFLNVFLEFRKAPYYEDWNNENVREEYEYLKKNGNINFMIVDGRVVGLVTTLYGIQENHNIKLDSNKVGYISDIAVLSEYRKRGIGTELMKYVIDEFKKEGIEYVYFRTIAVQPDGRKSLSEPIGIKLGFEILYDENGNLITQDCSFPRNNESIPEEEKREFLVKKI